MKAKVSAMHSSLTYERATPSSTWRVSCLPLDLEQISAQMLDHIRSTLDLLGAGLFLQISIGPTKSTSNSPIPPMSSNQNTVWPGGWSSGNGYKSQVSSTWLSGYQAVRHRNLANFGSFHYLGHWLVQQPYSCTVMMLAYNQYICTDQCKLINSHMINCQKVPIIKALWS